MSSYPWYEEIPAATPLTQGDIIEDCPVLRFRNDPWSPLSGRTLEDALAAASGYARIRAIVMTQACDLAQNKVCDAVLCQLESLDVWRTSWEGARRANGQEPTHKAFRSAIEEIRQGKILSSVLLQGFIDASGTMRMQNQIVSFARVYSLPVAFLQSWLVGAGGARTRLLPPYREHLSQAFARCFMRIGLPQDIQVPF